MGFGRSAIRREATRPGSNRALAYSTVSCGSEHSDTQCGRHLHQHLWEFAYGRDGVLGHERSIAEQSLRKGVGLSAFQRTGFNHIGVQSKFIQISEGQRALANV